MTEALITGRWKFAAVAVLLGWAYLPTFAFLLEKWTNEPQYSHGFLVPLFSAFLLWRRRNDFPTRCVPLPALGYSILVVALACRVVASWLYLHWLDAYSLLLTLSGIALVVGGVNLLRWVGPAVGFLVFMVPLPYKVELVLGQPLQRLATAGSTFLLQASMQPAIAEGNTILIDNVKLGVAEACSGLKMLITFVTFSVGAVLVLERTRLEKALILFSAVPIALFTNMLRIVGTGLAHVATGSDATVMGFIHDFNGWMMMPIGLAFLGVELWILKNLIVEPALPVPAVRQ